MPNTKENYQYVEMLGVHVVNTAHDGYRRAGFKLAAGENQLPPVTAAQWEMLSSDPRLVVSVIAEEVPAGSGDIAPGNVEQNALSSGVVTQAPEGDELPTLTRAERLSHACALAQLAIDNQEPLKFFNKNGTPRLAEWRAIVGDDLTADEIKAELEKAVV